MPTLKNRQRVGLGDFSGVRRQQPMRQNGCSLSRLFLAGILSQLYELYTDLSSRVMRTLEEMAPRVEVYSIDEAFLDLTGIESVLSLVEFGQQVRERIGHWIGITVCVGIAPTKHSPSWLTMPPRNILPLRGL